MGQIKQMLKCMWNKATMSDEQRSIYDWMTQMSNVKAYTTEIIVPIPSWADPQDMPKVKMQFELENVRPVRYFGATTPGQWQHADTPAVRRAPACPT